MKVFAKDYVDSFQEFADGRKGLNNLSLEILGGPNKISPLVMLRTYEEEMNVDVLAGLASAFCQNRTVRLYNGDVLEYEFDYSNGDIGDCFNDKPYLLDPFLKLCYAILIKKLTAPSPNSGTEDAKSESTT